MLNVCNCTVKDFSYHKMETSFNDLMLKVSTFSNADNYKNHWEEYPRTGRIHGTYLLAHWVVMIHCTYTPGHWEACAYKSLLPGLWLLQS
jgi:hypothetical protein